MIFQDLIEQANFMLYSKRNLNKIMNICQRVDTRFFQCEPAFFIQQNKRFHHLTKSSKKSNENENFDQYISSQTLTANTYDNEVVVGAALVKEDEVIYLQIKVGKLLPYYQIDQNTVRWMKIKPVNITNPDSDGSDYYVLKQSTRIDMDVLRFEKDEVLTGEH